MQNIVVTQMDHDGRIISKTDGYNKPLGRCPIPLSAAPYLSKHFASSWWDAAVYQWRHIIPRSSYF